MLIVMFVDYSTADENSSSSNRTTPAANSYGNRKAKKFEFASFKRF